MVELPIIHADGDPVRGGRIIGRALADWHARAVDFTLRYMRWPALAAVTSSRCRGRRDLSLDTGTANCGRRLVGGAHTVIRLNRRYRAWSSAIWAALVSRPNLSVSSAFILTR